MKKNRAILCSSLAANTVETNLKTLVKYGHKYEKIVNINAKIYINTNNTRVEEIFLKYSAQSGRN